MKRPMSRCCWSAASMEHFRGSERIASVAGVLALRDLPHLLAACALFIGCDSGPKHIAAASGVPTIGVHSGIVDPGEWGPRGERSVALYRDMSCAPCFLARPEDCSRGLACVKLLEPPLVFEMARVFLARPVERRAAAAVPASADVTLPKQTKRGARRVPAAVSARRVPAAVPQ